MARFIYRAKTASHQILDGTLEAENQSSAVQKLGTLGYYPIRLAREGGEPLASKDRRTPKKIPLAAMAAYWRAISDLVAAGLPLASALRMAVEQTPQAPLKEILETLEKEVREGKTLSETMEEFPTVFTPFCMHLIRAGEEGGMLGSVLTRLADYAEKDRELQSQIRGALTYPAFIVLVGLVTIGFLLGVIIPRLAALFTEFQQSLPWPTRFLLLTSSLFRRYLWLFALGIGALYALRGKIKADPRWRLRLDRLALRVPAWRAWLLHQEIAQFARTLGSLLENGIPILKALEASSQTLRNRVFQEAVAALQEPVRDGVLLSQGLKNMVLIPPDVYHLVTVGEQGGELHRSLLRIAERYERESQRYLKVAMSLLEPSLILVVGLILGGVVISVMLPIFDINTLIR